MLSATAQGTFGCCAPSPPRPIVICCQQPAPSLDAVASSREPRKKLRVESWSGTRPFRPSRCRRAAVMASRRWRPPTVASQAGFPLLQAEPPNGLPCDGLQSSSSPEGGRTCPPCRIKVRCRRREVGVVGEIKAVWSFCMPLSYSHRPTADASVPHSSHFTTTAARLHLCIMIFYIITSLSIQIS